REQEEYQKLEQRERESKEEERLEAKRLKETGGSRSVPSKEAQTKLSYREKREFEALPQEMEALETEKKEILAILEKGEEDFETLSKLSDRLAEIGQALEEKEWRWLSL